MDYKDVYYDADNLIGIYSFILVKSKVYDIFTHCKMIENFVTKDTLNSISGYLLITLYSCIRYIASLSDNNMNS